MGGRIRPRGRAPFGRAVAGAQCTRLGSGGAAWRSDGQGAVDTIYMGAWPRWVFDRVGMFDPDLQRNQDSELCLRVRAAAFLVCQGSANIRSQVEGREVIEGVHRNHLQCSTHILRFSRTRVVGDVIRAFGGLDAIETETVVDHTCHVGEFIAAAEQVVHVEDRSIGMDRRVRIGD